MTYSGDSIGNQDRTQVTGGAHATAAEFKPGQIIGNDYQVLAWIGAGGMGNVYRVRHAMMQAEYALKTLSADKITAVGWQRFQNEAKAIGRMSHPNIVGIYNLGLHDDRMPYYVMDLLKGQTLQDLIKAEGRLSSEDALKIMIEVSAGLSYAHKKGFIHRDIKPANIFLVEDPTAGSGRVKIVDFGIAKLTGVNDETVQKLTGAGEICGSPYYMSPEQCEGGKVDARSDVYSLGCTLFECLTGTPPYRGRNAMDTMLMHQTAKIPSLATAAPGATFAPELDRAIASMLAKEPMDRIQSMDAAGEELLDILDPYAREKRARAASSRSRGTREKDGGEKTDSKGTGKDAGQGAKGAGGAASENRSTDSPNRSSQSQTRGSQSLTQGARRPVINRSQLEEVAVGEAPKMNLKPLIIMAVSLILIGVGCVLFLPQQHKSGSGINTAPFASETVDKAGKKKIVFEFPKDDSLGVILIDSTTGGKDVKGIDCKGKQSVEAGHQLHFFPSEYCMHNPEYFYNFRPHYLTSVTIPGENAKSRSNVKAALEGISKLTGLTRLDLSKCTAVSDEMLPALDNCRDLSDIAINANGVSVGGLAKSQFINRIKALTYVYKDFDIAGAMAEHAEWESTHEGHHRFSREGEHRWRHHSAEDNHVHLRDVHTSLKQGVTPLLKCLAKSQNLTSLELPNVPLTNEDLKIIGTMKFLQNLDMTNSNITSASVALIADMPSLMVFHVDNCIIDASAIPSFKKLAAHSLKFIFMESPIMTPETVAKYRKELPGVEVNPG